MARTALNSPAHRILQKHPTGNINTSPDAAISLDYLGNGLLDHRMQYNRFNALGNGVLAAAVGWVGSPIPAILDQTIANAMDESICCLPRYSCLIHPSRYCPNESSAMD